jgi:hypothetical protein
VGSHPGQEGHRHSRTRTSTRTGTSGSAPPTTHSSEGEALRATAV